jgi:hypothetical protein
MVQIKCALNSILNRAKPNDPRRDTGIKTQESQVKPESIQGKVPNSG